MKHLPLLKGNIVTQKRTLAESDAYWDGVRDGEAATKTVKANAILTWSLTALFIILTITLIVK